MAIHRKSIKSNSRGPIATTTILIESSVIDVDESELAHLRASIAQIQTEKVQLKKEVANLRFEKDVLETTINVLKKIRHQSENPLKSRKGRSD